MPATKTGAILLASQSLAANGTVSSPVINLTGTYGCYLTAQVTNGATPPTVACTITIKTSPDGVNFVPGYSYTVGVSANGVYSLPIDLPLGVLYAIVTFSGNTGQAVTVAAQSQIANGL